MTNEILLTTTVGSFGKPDYLQKARNAHGRGKVSDDELRELERKATAEAVERCSERTPDLLARLDVPPASEPVLWLLYRLERLLRYDEAGSAWVLARRSKIHAGILEMFERDLEAD